MGVILPSMPRFLFPVNVANRGLDHIGETAIDESLGFNEDSKRALLCARLYDKLRRAELTRDNWVFAIRTTMLRPVATTTLALVPALWSDTAIYFPGSIVVDQYGTYWISNTAQNTNNDPLSTTHWDQYFGPLNVSLWDSTASYRAGELVYTTAGDGTNRVYLSLLDGNSDTPSTATAWSATTTYFKDQVITQSAVSYLSRIDNNLNQDPATKFFAEWASGTTYSAAQKVTGSDGLIYQSIAGSNVGFDPTTRPDKWMNTGVLSPWDSTFVGGTGSINWRQIGGAEAPSGVTVAPLNLMYPPGAGPITSPTTRNVYMLPANFLRRAPLAPKGTGSGGWWPSNHIVDDYDFLDRFFLSWLSDVIPFRFVADVTDVSRMHDMFCERLGARIGIEVCEPLSQSTAKKQAVASEYEKFGREAITINAILIGPEEPPEDEFITCRY